MRDGNQRAIQYRNICQKRGNAASYWSFCATTADQGEWGRMTVQIDLITFRVTGIFIVKQNQM